MISYHGWSWGCRDPSSYDALDLCGDGLHGDGRCLPTPSKPPRGCANGSPSPPSLQVLDRLCPALSPSEERKVKARPEAVEGRARVKSDEVAISHHICRGLEPPCPL